MEAPEQGWRKSSFSGDNGDCVEVAISPDAVAVRDSKNTADPVLEFPQSGWRAFLEGRDNRLH